jgi:hypothetical protein
VVVLVVVVLVEVVGAVEVLVVLVLVVLVLVVLVEGGAGDVVDAPGSLIDGVTTPLADISDPHAAATTATATARRVVRFTGSTVPDGGGATLAP